MSVPLHQEVFDDGHTRLYVNVEGVGADGKVRPEDLSLNLYAVRPGTAVPTFTIKLTAQDAARLFAQLNAVSVIRELGREVSGRFVEIDPDKVGPELLDAVAANPDLVAAVLSSNTAAVRRFVELELDDADVVGLAYRKKQLGFMAALLHDEDFFAATKAEWGCHGKEAVWQKFFDRNHWIFGYGLNYVVGDAFSDERLEQVTSGYSVEGEGKRADALMRTRGLVQALCFVEIKTHDAALLGKEYRPGCWEPSDELVGAVSQSHGTVHRALETIGTRLQERDPDGFEVGHLYNVQPRSFVVVGSLAEFVNDAGQVHDRKFRSLELYRRQLVAPEVITFDELLDRAKMIVEAIVPSGEDEGG